MENVGNTYWFNTTMTHEELEHMLQRSGFAWRWFPDPSKLHLQCGIYVLHVQMTEGNKTMEDFAMSVARWQTIHPEHESRKTCVEFVPVM